MSRLFLDPNRPLSTCTAVACEGCALHGHLQCHIRVMCSYCRRPFIRIDRSVREAIFDRNPLIRRAWKIDGMNDE
jgi:hypothetical protein